MEFIHLYSVLIIKTIVLYFYIIFVYRLMGKKELGQLSITDLICSLLIAELVALSIASHEKSVFESMIPILVIVLMQIGISRIALKSSKFRELLDGKPTVIIRGGKIMFDAMEKQRYCIEDLIMQVREQGYRSLEEVEHAVLETNGKLSVFDRVKKEDGEYPLPVIIDGVLNHEVLRTNNKDIDWINDILNKENIALQNVFYAFFKKDRLFIIKSTKN